MRKKLFITAVALASFIGVQSYSVPAYSGDREWATVGKILTGVVGAGLVYETMYDGYYYHPRTYYRSYYEVPDVIIIDRPYHGPYYRRGHHYYHNRYYDRSYYRPRHYYRTRHCH
ncbi:MAG: hypothetical protein AB1454_03995 [Candidatus Auribacterota bacterium]